MYVFLTDIFTINKKRSPTASDYWTAQVRSKPAITPGNVYVLTMPTLVQMVAQHFEDIGDICVVTTEGHNTNKVDPKVKGWIIPYKIRLAKLEILEIFAPKILGKRRPRNLVCYCRGKRFGRALINGYTAVNKINTRRLCQVRPATYGIVAT